ncbi:BQ2448_1895 [Microbotryum intermedium]|uniref:BQ2448_1895 protein n=1 Tax=Microbotryum intermedium TaxID=269621 RepID=A0A238FEH4_9BASI|nr:BQ2448_1895 [Microbotryum intermedium]
MATATQGESATLGMMVVIVIRAKNLPNRVKIGKQDPYCTLTYGIHKKRTETIERGGQQPTWDAEFRFEILRDSTEQMGAISGATVNKLGGVASAAGTVSDDGKVLAGFTNTAPAAGTSTLNADTRGRKMLKLACWADDPKDPKLVGEGFLELEPTIKKGAFDDWVKLERKGRYAGEVYLELTWYPKDPPPQKQRRHPPPSTLATGGAYGGPGARTGDVSEDEGSLPSPRKNSQESGSVISHASAASPLGDYPDADLAPLSHSFLHLNVNQNRPPLPAPPTGPPHSTRVYNRPQAYARPDASSSYPQPPPPPTTARATTHTYAALSHSPVYASQPQPAPQVAYQASYDHPGGAAMMQQPPYLHPIPPRQEQTYAYYQEGANATPNLGQFERLVHRHYERQQSSCPIGLVLAWCQHQPQSEADHDNSFQRYDSDTCQTSFPPLSPRHNSCSGYSYSATLPSALPPMSTQQGWAPAPAQLPSPGPVAPPRPHSTSSVHPTYGTHGYAHPPPPAIQNLSGYEHPVQYAQHHFQQQPDEYGRYLGSIAPPPPHSIASHPPPPALTHSHSFNDALGHNIPAPYKHAYAPQPQPPSSPPPPPPPVPSANPYHANVTSQPYGRIPPPPSIQQSYSMGMPMQNYGYYVDASGYAPDRSAAPGQNYSPPASAHATEPFVHHNPHAVLRS